MKLVKKFSKLISVLALIALSSVSMSTVSAGQLYGQYRGSFDSPWELYISSSNGTAELTYGFNTFLIHEDYAHAKHSTSAHYAALNNAKGWHTGPGKKAGSISKIEVTHTEDSWIDYYCYW